MCGFFWERIDLLGWMSLNGVALDTISYAQLVMAGMYFVFLCVWFGVFVFVISCNLYDFFLCTMNSRSDV